jgi:hypothetical protein
MAPEFGCSIAATRVRRQRVDSGNSSIDTDARPPSSVSERSDAVGCCAEQGLPFFKAVGGVGVPGVVTVVPGPDDLVEREGFATVVPAGEADVVVIVARRDLDKAAGGVG